MKDLDVNLILIQAFEFKNWIGNLLRELSHEISITSILTDKPQVSEKHPFVCYLWILHYKRRGTEKKMGFALIQVSEETFNQFEFCLKPLYYNSLKSLLDTRMMLPSV